MTASPDRRSAPRRAAWLGAAALLVPGIAVSASAAMPPATPPVDAVALAAPAALPTSWPAVPVGERLQPWLAEALTTAPATAQVRVSVSGETTAAALAAVQAVGLPVQQTWDKVGIVVTFATPAQVGALVEQPGVTYVEGDQPQEHQLQTAHQATRSDVALETFKASDGSRVDGAGVSIAVIDSGIDALHPMFTEGGQPTGTSKVVQNRKNVCGITVEPSLTEACFQPAPDTDSPSGGGHGTHVAGIAAGNEVTTVLPAGIELRGSAPGAKLVGLSVGATLLLIDSNSAMNWVVEHQQNPCRSKANQTEGEVDEDCPPIRATNHSYGPASDDPEGTSFNPNSATVRIQRMLVEQGVTPVWAAGNSDGDGSVSRTNPPGMDPTPGVLMVASYDDAQEGNRDNKTSTFSSRGKNGVTGTYPDISAPGTRITSACRATLSVCSTGLNPIDGGNYNTISGTSMATPYIAGVVAQLVQADPAITPGEVEDLLEDTAHKFTEGATYEGDPLNGDDITSFDKGHGLVDVAAVLAEQQGTAAPGGSTGGQPGGSGPAPGPGASEEPQPTDAPEPSESESPSESPSPSPSPSSSSPSPDDGQTRTQSLDSACPRDRVPANSQSDDDDNFHERAIECMVWWEIAKGKSSSDYDPEIAVNREQMAAFVARLVEKAGGELPQNPRNAFSDDDTSHHRLSIDKLAQAGLVDGKGGGRFAPNETVTRAQMAKFIVNAYEFVSPNSVKASRDYFSDDNSDTLEEFINESAEVGFTAGRNGKYEPREPVLRDQMASFLARTLDLLVEEGTTPAKK